MNKNISIRKMSKACIILGLCLLASSPSALAKSKVTWAYMADAEPINWKENGEAKGLEVEIVSHIMKQLGIEVEHKFYPWKRAQIMVERGKVDAMMTTPTKKRFQYAIFGKENALPNYWNIFIKKGNTTLAQSVAEFQGLEDLKGYKLVDFIGNGWSAAFLKKTEGYKIHEVSKLEQLPILLAKGRGDILINSSTWINWWAEKQGVSDQLEEHQTDGWPWTRFHFVFMVSRKSPWVQQGLIRAMDEELKKMKDSQIWYQMLRKFRNPHGYGVPFESYLDAAYEQQHGFYSDYESYPIFHR